MSLQPTPNSLNSSVEFDCPFTVHDCGSISFPRNVHGPDVYCWNDDDGSYHVMIAGRGWSFLNGFSGQHGYSGPVMHPSEYLGGDMARYVLETPGTYVVTAVYPLDGDGDELDGWVLMAMENDS